MIRVFLLVNGKGIRFLQLPCYAVFHHHGRVAGNDGVCFDMSTANTAASAYSGAIGKTCAFGNKAMTAKPYVVADKDFAVGIAAVARSIDQTVLVGIHKSAVPRGEDVVAKSDGFMTDYQRVGTEVEVVANGKDGVLCHLHRAARAEGALAKCLESASDVQNGAIITEIGTLAGAETDFYQAHFRLLRLDIDFPRKVLNHSAV